MKKSANVLLAIGAFAFVGCMHTAKKEEKAPPTPQQAAVSQLETDRTAYVNATQARIDAMTKLSSDLRNRAAQAQKPQSKKLENAADDMDSLLKDVTKDLAEVRNSAPENWVDYRRDVEKELGRAESQYSNSVHLLQ